MHNKQRIAQYTYIKYWKQTHFVLYFIGHSLLQLMSLVSNSCCLWVVCVCSNATLLANMWWCHHIEEIWKNHRFSRPSTPHTLRIIHLKSISNHIIKSIVNIFDMWEPASNNTNNMWAYSKINKFIVNDVTDIDSMCEPICSFTDTFQCNLKSLMSNRLHLCWYVYIFVGCNEILYIRNYKSNVAYSSQFRCEYVWYVYYAVWSIRDCSVM